ADPAPDVPAEPVPAAVRVGGRALRRRLARRAPATPAASTRPAADPVPNRRDQRAPHHPAQR
uniref:hypothetical protein n=1 Tax=Catellatospora paridis TaxID=1617086 RepID=UPI001E5916DA